MDKKTIVNNGWVTDVAVACDDNVTVDSALFESCITHADVHELVYGDETATTTVDEPEVIDETPEVIDETPEVINEPEVIDETPEVIDEPGDVDLMESEDEDPVEPEA